MHIQEIALQQNGLMFITVDVTMIPDSTVTEISIVNEIMVSLQLNFA